MKVTKTPDKVLVEFTREEAAEWQTRFGWAFGLALGHGEKLLARRFQELAAGMAHAPEPDRKEPVR